MKLAILGFSGSGKSTLAKQLGSFYQIPVLHLDTIQFQPNWVIREKEEGQQLVKEFMTIYDSWVIDGNYTGFYQQERLDMADEIIYLNFSRLRCLMRVLNRYRQNKGKTRSDMADGCIEKIDWPFIWWVLAKGRSRSRRKHYKLVGRDYSDKFIELKNPRQVSLWLTSRGIDV
ncbi:DNA topology modulation protein FlaR [Vagococcus penaei]|uniref:DNA topology modulation protein FlaR n=1 Tax=Vagococcus penaei TaxID=633807 RepID=A0A1Q2D3W8_9ENTE|nr:DNA topology modulation protein FlaR [Vagococcus penaei]AQP53023.1 DNA topology modulation protein FlaR [Vagococcus penaei]RSU06115.1 DNA topology modulation protein FlaR [Vagococcus penaei]